MDEKDCEKAEDDLKYKGQIEALEILYKNIDWNSLNSSKFGIFENDPPSSCIRDVLVIDADEMAESCSTSFCKEA